MKRRVLIMVLVFLVALAMMPMAGFAATKVVTTQETQYEKYDGDWRMTEKATYTYNSKARLTKSVYINRFYGDNNAYTSEKSESTKTYNSKGRLKTEIKKADGIYYKSVYYYTSSGKFKEIKYYKKKASASKYSANGHTKYTYSSTKNTITEYNVKGKVESKKIQLLDSKKRVKTEKYYLGTTLEETRKYTYYSTGVVKKIVKTGNGMTITENYNKKGQVTTAVVEESDFYRFTTYTYDSYGRLKKEVSEVSDDYDSTTYTTTYKYSKYYKTHKHPLTVLVYDYGDGEATRKTVYKYKSI